uniref:Uncharacterized protein n=1 Tax=Arundo donax TaxID=35708 RepID=A0A0A9DSY7_ARUDO
MLTCLTAINQKGCRKRTNYSGSQQTRLSSHTAGKYIYKVMVDTNECTTPVKAVVIKPIITVVHSKLDYHHIQLANTHTK